MSLWRLKSAVTSSDHCRTLHCASLTLLLILPLRRLVTSRDHDVTLFPCCSCCRLIVQSHPEITNQLPMVPLLATHATLDSECAVRSTGRDAARYDTSSLPSSIFFPLKRAVISRDRDAVLHGALPLPVASDIVEACTLPREVPMPLPPSVAHLVVALCSHIERS